MNVEELTPIAELGSEQMREFNVKAAEKLGLDVSEGVFGAGYRLYYNDCQNVFCLFTNAADKDMLVEKLRIYTHPNSFDNYATWNCFSPTFPHAADETDSSMTAAQIKAICACLD